MGSKQRGDNFLLIADCTPISTKPFKRQGHGQRQTLQGDVHNTKHNGVVLFVLVPELNQQLPQEQPRWNRREVVKGKSSSTGAGICMTLQQLSQCEDWTFLRHLLLEQLPTLWKGGASGKQTHQPVGPHHGCRQMTRPWPEAKLNKQDEKLPDLRTADR